MEYTDVSFILTRAFPLFLRGAANPQAGALTAKDSSGNSEQRRPLCTHDVGTLRSSEEERVRTPLSGAFPPLNPRSLARTASRQARTPPRIPALQPVGAERGGAAPRGRARRSARRPLCGRREAGREAAALPVRPVPTSRPVPPLGMRGPPLPAPPNFRCCPIDWEERAATVSVPGEGAGQSRAGGGESGAPRARPGWVRWEPEPHLFPPPHSGAAPVPRCRRARSAACPCHHVGALLFLLACCRNRYKTSAGLPLPRNFRCDLKEGLGESGENSSVRWVCE